MQDNMSARYESKGVSLSDFSHALDYVQGYAA
jgi:hypothetical protein